MQILSAADSGAGIAKPQFGRIERAKPRILINVCGAKAEGTAFGAKLLQLADLSTEP